MGSEMCIRDRDWTTHPISLLLVRIGLRPELLNSQEQTDPIANFVDTHFLQDFLVHLQEVLAIDVVFAEELLVVAALDGPQVLAHALLVPVLDRVGAVGVGEFGFGRTGERLARGDGYGSSPHGGVARLLCVGDQGRALGATQRGWERGLRCQHRHREMDRRDRRRGEGMMARNTGNRLME